jgi:hypothetical protein
MPTHTLPNCNISYGNRYLYQLSTRAYKNSLHYLSQWSVHFYKFMILLGILFSKASVHHCAPETVFYEQTTIILHYNLRAGIAQSAQQRAVGPVFDSRQRQEIFLCCTESKIPLGPI